MALKYMTAFDAAFYERLGVYATAVRIASALWQTASVGHAGLYSVETSIDRHFDASIHASNL